MKQVSEKQDCNVCSGFMRGQQRRGRVYVLASLAACSLFLSAEARAEIPDAGRISREIMQELPNMMKEEGWASFQMERPQRSEASPNEAVLKAEERNAVSGDKLDMTGLPPEMELVEPIQKIVVLTPLLQQEIEELLAKHFMNNKQVQPKGYGKAKNQIWALGLKKQRLLHIKFKVLPGTKDKGQSYLIAEVKEIAVRQVLVKDVGRTPVRKAVLADVQEKANEIFFAEKPVALDDLDALLKKRLHLGDIGMHASVVPVDDLHVDLSITVEGFERTRPHFAVQIDNSGDWSFGRDRVTGSMSMGNVAISGDQLSIQSMKTMDIGNFDAEDGTYFGREEYQAPIGEWDLRVVGWMSGLHYHQVEHVRSNVQANGEALEIGGGVIKPIYLSETSLLELRTDYIEKYTVDRILEDVRTSEKQAHDGRVRADLTMMLDKNQQLQFGAGFTTGDVDLSNHKAAFAQDQAGPKANGLFAKLEVDGQWQGKWDEASDFDFRVKTKAQVAASNLDGMEKFTLGGASGLRAFGSGEASGDAGYLFSGDLGYSFGFGFHGGIFYDMGEVLKSMDPWETENGNLNYTLQDVGVAFTQRLDPIALSLTFAHQVGPNAGLSTNGIDADNSKQRYRIWSSVSWQY